MEEVGFDGLHQITKLRCFDAQASMKFCVNYNILKLLRYYIVYSMHLYTNLTLLPHIVPDNRPKSVIWSQIASSGRYEVGKGKVRRNICCLRWRWINKYKYAETTR